MRSRDAKRANTAVEKALKERNEMVRKGERESKIIAGAKKIAGFSGHIGWQTYLKASEELKKAVEECEKAELESAKEKSPVEDPREDYGFE